MNNNCNMSLTTSPNGRTLDTELPENREYEDAADAELDEALVQAIRRAEDAEKEFLAKLLRKELKSHYYETRLES